MQLYWKSEVHKVKRKCDKTVPSGAPVLHLRKNTALSDELWSACQVEGNAGDGGYGNSHHA